MPLPGGLPTPQSDAGVWGTELNTWLQVAHNADGTLKAGVPATGNSIKVLNLVADYSLSQSAGQENANKTKLLQAFTDSQGLVPIYVPPGRYPMAFFLMPTFPILLFGAGKDTSVFVFPAFTAPGQNAVSYLNTDAGRIQSGSPWFNTSTNGTQSVHTWNIRDMAFEGPSFADDSLTNAGNGFFFPKWTGTGNIRATIFLSLFNVAICCFRGVGLNYDMSGLNDDATFVNVVIHENAGDGCLVGSDSRFVNLISFHNGGWGLNQVDNRTLQLTSFKTYGNGINPATRTAGGMRLVGDFCVASDIYSQDNSGTGIFLDGARGTSISRIVSDRNCVAAFNAGQNIHSAIIMNNVEGCIIDGFVSTESAAAQGRTAQQTHCIKITGANTAGSNIFRGVNIEYDPANPVLSSFVESTSGGVNVFSPITQIAS